MRKRFDAQIRIGSEQIADIYINPKCRDEMPALMRAMKEIYLNAEISAMIYQILEDKICKGKKKTGRQGMNLWMIFVLAQTRLCLNTNYDRLHYLANNDKLLREMMGIYDGVGDNYEIDYQRIIDNISLLDDATLRKINDVIVDFGHGVFKKKETEALRVKTDTFVVEGNVHFPTDINLLWDSGRKCLDCVGHLINEGEISAVGWRKYKDWRRGLKNAMRSLSQLCKRSGPKKPETIIDAANQYINKAIGLSKKVNELISECPIETTGQLAQVIRLEYYKEMLDKHIDLVNRRLIKGETIPQKEKIFSIFETYTEWITKGKQNPNVELGKKVSITTDQYHLIIDFLVVEKTADVNLILPIVDRLLIKNNIESISSDKGGWSRENKELLQLVIPKVIIPKKGKLNQEEQIEEHGKGFKKLRHLHSAVESNINELEYCGLDRCPDRGLHGFKRYVAIAVVAYNLHRIGKELLALDKSQAVKRKPIVQAHRHAA